MGFNAKSNRAVEGYIRDRGLASAAAKAATKKKAAHTQFDLKTATAKEMIKVDKGYAVLSCPLNVKTEETKNVHPNRAPLRSEPVRIVGEGKAAVDAALEKAHDRNCVLLSYIKGHDAEFAALLENLEESDPERYERLVKIKKD